MSYLESLYESFDNKLDKFLDSPKWKIKIVVVALVAMLLSFFNNITPFFDFKRYYEKVVVQRGEFFLYEVTKDRSKKLTEHHVYEEPASNNRVFRLTLPVIVKVLHISHVSVFIYGLQLLLGVLFYYLLVNFLYSILNDKKATLLASIAFACIYFGTAFFIENGGYGDFYTFFFLFLAIYLRNPFFVFLSMFAAAWCDERAVVAGGLVFLWWWLSPAILGNKKISLIPNKQMLALIVAEIGYLAGRFYLMHYEGMKATYKEGEFSQMITDSLPSFGFKMIWVIEGFWLIMLLAFVILYTKKDLINLFFMGIGTIGMIFLGMTTYDSTRSGSVVFPMLFLGILIIRKHLTDKQLRIILFLVALICFLHPLATKTRGVGYFLM